MKLLKIPYHGFDHKAVNKYFSGGLTFCNEFCVNGEYTPVAVYKVANPDKSKGHKEYLLLQKNKGKGLVRGMTAEEIELYRFQDGVHCLTCEDVIFSMNRHDSHSCTCGKVSIDGGKDYTKVSFEPKSLYEMVTIDLLTDNISLKDN